MKILITAGTTLTMIDKVRALTNIFTGRTGMNIAMGMTRKGHEVVLLTSNRYLEAYEIVKVIVSIHMSWKEKMVALKSIKKIKTIEFKTYDDLMRKMRQNVVEGNFDAIIHSAAVSDYRVTGVYVKNESGGLEPVDDAGKISSKHEKLYMELSPTEKIVDLIRTAWNFSGCLVKFKLEVGISDEELLEIAKVSRDASDADFIVANCLEWSAHYAYVVDRNDVVKKVSRRELPEALEIAVGNFG